VGGKLRIALAGATGRLGSPVVNLHAAGQRAGVRGIVVVSIIGIDAFTGGYNAAKLAHEQAMLAGSLPVQILRAAQFHELVGQFVEWGTHGEVSYVPEMRVQLVAAKSVAEVLADLATGVEISVSGASVPEIAGPRVESFVDAARLLVARRGGPPTVEGVTDQADPDRDLYEGGAPLPGPGAITVAPTFEAWLDEVA
jgi:uncharacterized protein YbjT (DUF2867 family)